MQMLSVNSALKIRPALLAVAQLVVLALAGVALGQQSNTTSVQQVQSVFDRMVDAARRGDDDALATFFAPDATFIDGSGFNKGFAAYNQRAKADVVLINPASSFGGNAAHSQSLDYSVSNVEVRASGSVAWVTYKYSLNIVVNGSTTPIAGFGTTIFQLVGTDWKVAHSQTAGKIVR